jgi:small GTP-binding protein
LLRGTLNLGILAHVDAGKTTLTERLLHAAGVIDEVGSVDDGTTQTDTLPLERQRGITIKSAVVSFAIDDVTVNLIDTPGHPDFIAEVERVLSVLDGAVLVISAVEGVQPQTRVLMRALARLGVPTLMFVNKIDRPGADCERVLQAISERLTPAIVPLGSVREPGTRAARFTPSGAADAAFAARLADVLAGARRRAPGRVRRRRDERSLPATPRAARGAEQAGARASGLLRLGADRSSRRLVDERHRRAAAGDRRRRRRPRQSSFPAVPRAKGGSAPRSCSSPSRTR